PGTAIRGSLSCQCPTRQQRTGQGRGSARRIVWTCQWGSGSMTYSLTWLPEVLEGAGLKVAETPDWRTRGRAEMGDVKGVMCHHTGTTRGGNMPTLDVLIRGRSDLIGPLCQLGLGRDGTYYVVAAG